MHIEERLNEGPRLQYKEREDETVLKLLILVKYEVVEEEYRNTAALCMELFCSRFSSSNRTWDAQTAEPYLVMKTNRT